MVVVGCRVLVAVGVVSLFFLLLSMLVSMDVSLSAAVPIKGRTRSCFYSVHAVRGKHFKVWNITKMLHPSSVQPHFGTWEEWGFSSNRRRVLLSPGAHQAEGLIT